MDYEKLDQLMAIPKKSDASNAMRREYLVQMERLFNEEGLSINAQKYLWEGLSFCGAQPLGDYLRTFPKEERFKVVQDFTRSSSFIDNDQATVFRLCTSLLGYFINHMPDNTDVIALLIKHFLSKYKKKDGSVFKKNISIIEKYFVSPYVWGCDFPVWDTLGLNANISIEFCEYMIKTLSDTNRKYEQKISRIVSWLKSGLPQEETNRTHNKNTVDMKQETTQCYSETTTEDGHNNTESTAVSASYESADIQALFKVAKHLEVCSQQVRIFATIYRKLTSDNEKLETQYQEQQKKTKEVYAELTETRSELEELSLTLQKAEAENKELHEEISRLQSVISVYSADKQSSMDSQLNAIASKLKHEYNEFMDAMDMEMTVEIGEILRDQLYRVFRALIKAGIDVENR